jgi:hypothetical protein
MSGSSGGNDFGGGGGGALPFNCNSVSIRTNVIAPDPTVLATVNVRDVLSITLRTNTGPLQAVTAGGAVLGTVFIMELAELIQCISDGNSYKAVILSIAGGDVQIIISRR